MAKSVRDRFVAAMPFIVGIGIPIWVLLSFAMIVIWLGA